MNQLQIHGLCNLFIVKAQINYMWSLKKFKWVKFYVWILLIIYFLKISTQSVYTAPWKYTRLKKEKPFQVKLTLQRLRGWKDKTM
jgi:hypothetical protein